MGIKIKKVTFDQNVLDLVCGVNGNEYEQTGACLREYILKGKIHGFVPDSFFPIENLQRDEKYKVLSEFMRGKNGANYEMSIFASQRLEKIKELNIRALVGTRIFDWSPGAHCFFHDFLDAAPFSLNIINRTNEVAEKLWSVGLGRAQIVELGNNLNKMAFPENDRPRHWTEGFNCNTVDWKHVVSALGEWIDADLVSSHVGYENDYLCTRDFGSNSGSKSTLHPVNRDWLSKEYNIKFVTPVELIKILE